MRADQFVDPPNGVYVRSADDTVIVASHRSLLKTPARTRMGFLRIGCAGFGVVFCLFGLAAVWLSDAPFNMNGQEVPKAVGTLVFAGFMAVWITIALFILGRMERVVLIFLGKDPPIGWRLRLNDDLWVADRLLGFNMKTHRFAPQDVMAVKTDDSGCLLVKAEGKDVPITIPLEPDVADWMTTRLFDLI